MCLDCGCEKNEGFRVAKPGAEHDGSLAEAGGRQKVPHDHAHTHHHRHGHDHGATGEPHRHYDPATGEWFEHAHGVAGTRTIDVGSPILEQNDRLAERNRGFFSAHGTVALNLMSSPGSGKTALLEKTLEALAPDVRAAVLVGDLATDLDGRRLDGRGAQVLQITTGTTCHLDARMVAAAAAKLDWKGLRVLFIENVGNLVCPASFDLGEKYRVVLFSVTEGEEKPLKYPSVFRKADVVLLTKSDLAEVVGFDRERALGAVRAAAPHAVVFEVSAKTGEGMQGWVGWIQSLLSPG